VVRISTRALRGALPVALAVASLAATSIARAPLPAIVTAAAAIGVIAHRLAPRSLPLPAPSSERTPPVAVPLARTIRVALVCAAAWWLPVAAVALAAPDSLYLEQALVFSKAAVITFGGAYAALAYVGQRAIAAAWVTPGQLVDALGLAETTPGPLVLVLPFVGFVAAYPVDGLGGGVAAALLAAWVTFAPSFLWILVGAPYVEWLRGNRPLAAALAAITAAVVGVIANLSLWFAAHTLFAARRDVAVGPWTVEVPILSSIDAWTAAGVAVAVAAVVVGKVKTPWLLAGCAGFGLARLLLGQ
jgi:chromate transporter